jgi:dGTPase
MEKSYLDKVFGVKLMPATLEGAVMRVSDIIAYLGKDRQDADRLGLLDEQAFENTGIGSINAEIINNLEVNIIENSYGQPFIALDDQHFKALQAAKRDNYKMIYSGASPYARLDETVRPMMAQLYDRLLADLLAGDRSSYIFTHHIDYVNQTHYKRERPYEETEPNQLVVDYIASMTDDYFIDLYNILFPDSPYRVRYRGYFEEMRDRHV